MAAGGGRKLIGSDDAEDVKARGGHSTGPELEKVVFELQKKGQGEGETLRGKRK